MLAVSSYGSNSNDTTTGNDSGIWYMNCGNSSNDYNKYEYTANIIANNGQWFAENLNTAATSTNGDAKYVNVYANNSSRINGDALNIGSRRSDWDTNNPVVARGFSGLFGYFSSPYGDGYTRVDKGNAITTCSSRATVACGSGF